MSVKPARPDVVKRWKPLFHSAELILVLNPTGVRAPVMDLFRRALRAPGFAIVMVRNATGLALADGHIAQESLQRAFRGPSMVVLVQQPHPAIVANLIALLQPHNLANLAKELIPQNVAPPRVRGVWHQGTPLPIESWTEQLQTSLRQTQPEPLVPMPTSGALHRPASDLQALRTSLQPIVDIHAKVGTSITLQSAGQNKILVCKAIKSWTGMGLKTILTWVEEAPSTFDMATFEKAEALRNALRNLGASVEEVPDDRWQPWNFETEALFDALPGFALVPGWKIFALMYRSWSGGNGVVCAVPEFYVHYASHNAGSSIFPRRPACARDVNEVLSGDGSPLSYLTASILRKELAEFAAYWHGVTWWTHTFVDQLPEEPWVSETHDLESLDLRPQVAQTDSNTITVTFWTTSDLGSIRLVCHQDIYRIGSYAPTSSVSRCCATAGGGYVH